MMGGPPLFPKPEPRRPRPVSLTVTRASFSLVTVVSIVSVPPLDFDMAPRAF